MESGFDETALYQGFPFTGEVVEETRGGVLVALTTYVDGVPDGVTKEWYPDGAKRSEGYNSRGRAIGTHVEWHKNGTLAREARFSDTGGYLGQRRWDDDGTLTLDDF
ncbi:toxin-antitoxin system YwqK family antitoxin [Actinopolyspora biskrensis]|uniref:toxin-antitoxin system YwqK family antitoxin n=1 Tax=Actinopolyspora biskrensis TaxID=1470178 RepID=UPI0015CEE8C8|nr:hypothetical protein [Actinopolyspora biskrensis]